MKTTISRLLERPLLDSLKEVPIVAILGPRQCGKTTLARIIERLYPEIIHLDMEQPENKRALTDPVAFFRMYANNCICIDEIQKVPDLFPIMRADVDNQNRNGRFIVLGSASPDLLRQTSETLAGRIRYLELTPFIIPEIARDKGYMQQLWLRGGFPRSFLAPSDEISFRWRQDFIKTFLEREIPGLGFRIPASSMERFWTMIAHVNAQMLNRSKFGESLGVSHHSVQHHLDILSDCFMIRVLKPLEVNLKKRLVKSPKIILRDTGILHALLGIRTQQHLLSHPERGSSWESFAIENMLNVPAVAEHWKSFFYRSHVGDEIDLILDNGITRIAIECKASSAPDIPRGFYTAIKELNIQHAWIVAPVDRVIPVGNGIMVGGIMDVVEAIRENS
jgi:hypothetical protein